MTPFLNPAGLQALVSLGWLILALLVFLSALPLILRLSRERTFRLHIAGMEVSVQDAAHDLAQQVGDLQDRLRLLEKAMGDQAPGAPRVAVEPTPSTEAQSTRPRRILWVDDNPTNNAFAVEKLRSDGFEVVAKESTVDGFAELRMREFGMIISDMGRVEQGRNNATAGLDLLKVVRVHDPALPLVFFCSKPAIARAGQEALRLGATGITASAVELYEHVDAIFGRDP
jgi:CheY-like chemotaxis protein